MIWILLVLFIVQLTFALLYSYRPSTKFTVSLKETEWPKVSMLICAKNEAENLKLNLPQLLNQKYDFQEWECLVVNDGSTDESAHILEAFCRQFSNLRVHTILPETKRDLPGKKFALREGLKFTKHEAILLTDADCWPSSTSWLKNMAESYAQKEKQSGGDAIFILGYGAYQKTAGLLNQFVRWETVHTFIQYASWARIGFPYMGVGRNLMYRKNPVLDLLTTDKAFLETFVQAASGDDDLIVSALSNIENTKVVDDKNAQTISNAPETFKQWWKQKSRHVSSGKYYTSLVKFGLGLYAISSFLFLSTAIFMLASYSGRLAWIVLLLFVLRTFAFWGNSWIWNKQLGEQKLTYFHPFGEVLWLLYNFAISPFIFWKNKQQWK